MLNEKRMILGRFLLGMLMTLLLFGCSTHVDNLSKFHIEGEVIAQESGVPVQGAVLFFTDTGFDYVRSKNMSAQRVGRSDSSGKLSLKFDYLWGENKSIFTRSSPQTFILSLEHPTYQPVNIPLRATDFPIASNEIQINLGIVKLTTSDPIAPVR